MTPATPTLDGILRATLTRHRWSTGRQQALALLTAATAADPGKPAATQVNRWLTRTKPGTAHPDLAGILTNPKTRSQLASHVRRRTRPAGSSLLSGAGVRDARVAAVRRIVGLVVGGEPPGVAAGWLRKRRVVAAVVGCRILGSGRGWDSTLVDGARLGVAVGVSPATARSWINGCHGNVVTVRQRRAGAGFVVALRRLPKAVGVQVAEDQRLSRVVTDMADLGEPDVLPRPGTHPLAVLLFSAQSALWGYGADAADWALWEAAVLISAGQEVPRSSRLRPAAAARVARQRLAALGIDLDAPGDVLADQIAEAASRSGATSRRNAAEAARAHAAAVRRDEIELHRRRSAALRPLLAAVMAGCPSGPVGADDPASRAAANGWLAAARQVVADAEVPPAARRFVRGRVRALMVRAGHDGEMASAAALRICPVVDGETTSGDETPAAGGADATPRVA